MSGEVDWQVNPNQQPNTVGGEWTKVDQSTIALDEGVQLELDLLQKIQTRANEVHNIWAGEYLPCELATLTEVCSTPKQTVAIGLVADKAIAEIDKQYANVVTYESIFESLNCMVPECLMSTRLNTARVRSMSWQVQGALRFEETKVDLENKQRLNNKIVMISPGRGGVARSTNALAAAAKIHAESASIARASKGGDAYAAGRALGFLQTGVAAAQKSGFFDQFTTQQPNLTNWSDSSSSASDLSPNLTTWSDTTTSDMSPNLTTWSDTSSTSTSFDTSKINGFV